MLTMKKYFIGFLLTTVTAVGYSQSKFSNALGGGLDYNYNLYFDYNNYTPYQVNHDFNLDLTGAIQLGKKIRLRLEFNYSKFSYGQRYTIVQSSNDALIKSEMTIHNLGIIPRLDYKLITFSKFDLYISPGFKFDINLNYAEASTTTAGKVISTEHMNYDYDNFMQGISGGLLLKYNITKHLSVNLVPDYTFYLGKFYNQNSGNLQRMSGNLEVEWLY